ncbi:MAG: hypothetical protein ACRD8O_09235 [Bryobacteraceae bacterium]
MDTHILIAFLAYCLQVTLKNRLQIHAPGLTPTAVLEKLATVQMIDVWIPTRDGRWLIPQRYTQPSKELKLDGARHVWANRYEREVRDMPSLQKRSAYAPLDYVAGRPPLGCRPIRPRDSGSPQGARTREKTAPDAFGALVYAALGQKDDAFRWVETAYKNRHPFTPWFRAAPFKPLHDDPRFHELMRRMNLPVN